MVGLGSVREVEVVLWCLDCRVKSDECGVILQECYIHRCVLNKLGVKILLDRLSVTNVRKAWGKHGQH